MNEVEISWFRCKIVWNLYDLSNYQRGLTFIRGGFVEMPQNWTILFSVEYMNIYTMLDLVYYKNVNLVSGTC